MADSFNLLSRVILFLCVTAINCLTSFSARLQYVSFLHALIARFLGKCFEKLLHGIAVDIGATRQSTGAEEK